jgi:hypothetical protein
VLEPGDRGVASGCPVDILRAGASADCTCAETKEPVFFGERPAWGIASAYEILYVRTPCSLLNDSMLTIFPNVAMNPRTECFCH